MRTFKWWVAAMAVVMTAAWAAAQTVDYGAAEAAVFATEKQPQAKELERTLEKSTYAAHTLAELTGMAINPLFVAAALGAYRYYTTPEEARTGLPWFYKPWFWAICLALAATVLIISLISDTINLPPAISAIPELCNKNIGLALTSPIVFGTITKFAGEANAAAPTAGLPYTGASVIPWDLFSGVSQTIWYISIVPMMLFTFFAMWLLNLTFDVLMLLSPFGFIDLGLKIARGIFFAVLLTVAVLAPQLVFVLVIPIMIVSIILFGWSARRVIMGFVFSWDFLFKRKGVAPVGEKGIVAFSDRGVKIPLRSVGRLTEKDGDLRFSYRRFLLFPRTITLHDPELILRSGFLCSKLCDNGTAAYLLPPRYRKYAAKEMQPYLRIQRVEYTVLKKGFRDIVEWFKRQSQAA